MNPLSSLSNDLRQPACRLVIEPMLRASMPARVLACGHCLTWPHLPISPALIVSTGAWAMGAGMDKACPTLPEKLSQGHQMVEAAACRASTLLEPQPRRHLSEPHLPSGHGSQHGMAWQAGQGGERDACVRFRMKLIRKPHKESFAAFSIFASPLFLSAFPQGRSGLVFPLFGGIDVVG